MPKRRADEMVLLFVDEIAFSKHWREYAASVLKDWRETCAMVSPYFRAVVRRDEDSPLL